MHFNRSMQGSRLAWLAGLVILAVLAVPSAASAQAVTPTDTQYGDGPRGTPDSGGSISELPFTGLDLVAIVAIGIGLLGAAFVIRRVTAGSDGSA